jgi:hypothetical protein
VAKVQHHAKLQPIVFDYDEAHARLRVVDNQFLLYLASTDVEAALSHLPAFPNEVDSDRAAETDISGEPEPDSPE